MTSGSRSRSASRGATTVASTSALAHVAGIEVFATGGLGGVHRGAAESFDISADLGVLGRTPVLVVCAGVKSILDVPATLEYLETLSVPVIGYRTDAFPGFYLSDSGAGGAVAGGHRRAGRGGRPGPRGARHRPRRRWCWPTRCRPTGSSTRTCTTGRWPTAWPLLADEGVTGKDVTPRLLEYFHSATHGESLRVNVELVLANAFLAGEVAAALARHAGGGRGSPDAVTAVRRRRPPTPQVTVIGDVGLDVLARVAGPVALGQDTRARVSVAPGGAGGNTAAWLARHDLDVTLIARVGADEAGRTAAAELSAAGVRCRFAVDDVLPTCCVVVVVAPDGDRTMLSDRGANAALSPDDVTLRAGDRPRPSAPVGIRVAGQRLPPRRAGRAAAGDGHGLDHLGGPAGRLAPGRRRRRQLPDAGSTAWTCCCPTIPNWTRWAARPPPCAAARTVVVTHGRHGASWLTATETFSVPTPGAGRPRIPTPRRHHAKDTTGAGDAFNAGLLASWLRGDDPEAALRHGVAAGTAATGRVRRPRPDRRRHRAAGADGLTTARRPPLTDRGRRRRSRCRGAGSGRPGSRARAGRARS